MRVVFGLVLVGATQATRLPTYTPQPDRPAALATPLGYSHLPLLPVVHGVRVALNKTSWSPCVTHLCLADVARCESFFDDACLCYPGLLRCAQRQCPVDGADAMFASCLQAQANNDVSNRCDLSCVPSTYPLSPNDDAMASMDWTVTASLTIQGVDTTSFNASAFEFIEALVSVLHPRTTHVASENVSLATLDLYFDIVNEPVIQVNATVYCDSPATMNLTASLLEVMRDNGTWVLGTKLVEARVLFDTSQVDLQAVVAAARETTTEPANVASSRTSEVKSPTRGLPPWTIVGIVLGCVAGVALIVVFGYWWRNRNGAQSSYILHDI
ncbi:Aste57867_14561 [Aphanomyces stellatus]|uniref:Aste57867_14561 protein n=1 Tax=Aphanomyces stellatus TaxID=120398 RepID=A0A485L101_9STRA|nr:hypothetical protein As57867_014507 [Aphanomyces stellatus]VFT91381.1 Aste57867_14561 [Aphanomyces stellatus]